MRLLGNLWHWIRANASVLQLFCSLSGTVVFIFGGQYALRNYPEILLYFLSASSDSPEIVSTDVGIQEGEVPLGNDSEVHPTSQPYFNPTTSQTECHAFDHLEFGCVLALGQEYHWPLQGHTTLEAESQGAREFEPRRLLRAFFRQTAPRNLLRSATDLIAVGTASCEGGQLRVQERLAGQRSHNLARWLAHSAILPARPSREKVRIWELNMGQYQPHRLGKSCTSSQSSNQRRVLFLAVRRNHPSHSYTKRELEYYIQEILEGLQNFPEFRPSLYSWLRLQEYSNYD